MVRIVALVFLGVLALAPAIACADVVEDIALVSTARVTVTRADFDAELARIPENDRFEFLSSRERIGKILEDLLVMKTLANEGRGLGLDRSAQTARKMEIASQRVLAQERFEHLAEEAKTADFANFELRAEEVYRLNPEKYTDKPMVRASHILIDFKGRSKEEALKRAREVYAKATVGGDFATLAAEYSDDNGSKASQGDLGYFTADKMVKPFADAAFALKKGEIGAPVETQFGFHVIKVIDVKPGGKRDYAAVKTEILEELKAQYLAEMRKAHIDAIRGGKDVKVNEEEIMKIKTARPTGEHKH